MRGGEQPILDRTFIGLVQAPVPQEEERLLHDVLRLGAPNQMRDQGYGERRVATEEASQGLRIAGVDPLVEAIVGTGRRRSSRVVTRPLSVRPRASGTRTKSGRRGTGWMPRAGVLRRVRFDQLQASLALIFETSFGDPFRLPNLVDDPTDAREHGLVVALDHEAQRHDVELVVIESTRGERLPLRRGGSATLRCSPSRAHRTHTATLATVPDEWGLHPPAFPGAMPAVLWAGSDVKAGIYDRGAKG